MSGLLPLGAETSAQVFSVPQGEVENVRFEQTTGGVLEVSYDLVSDDPDAVFSVELHVSQDAGTTFDMIPTSVTGDIGPGVTVGTGKRIVWEAGRDVERLQIDLFRFRIVTEAASTVPAGMAGLDVESDPAGAAVSVDGTARGVTPLSLSDLLPGEHEVVFSLTGYLENRRTLTINQGAVGRLDVTLTPLTDEQLAAATDAGGGANLKVILPIVAGGAAAALVALSGGSSTQGGSNSAGGGNTGGGNPILSCTFSVSPTSFMVTTNGGAERRIDVRATPANCGNPAYSVTGVPSFITVTSAQNGTAPATVTFRITANTTAVSRTANFQVAGQTVTVMQDAGRTGSGCSVRRIALGQTLAGRLQRTDCSSPNRPFAKGDLYTFQGTAGQQVTIAMNSPGSGVSDPYVILAGPSGAVVRANDDGGPSLGALIAGVTLPTTGAYTIEATSSAAGDLGTYTISLR